MSTNGRREQLGVLAQTRLGPSAIKYYRVEVPMQAIEKQGLGRTVIDDGVGDRDIFAQAQMGADIIVQWRPIGQPSYENIKVFSELEPQNRNGSIILPPLHVVDSDDAVDYVHPFNYVFNMLGIRNWDGTLLEPGDKITVKVNGEERTLWEDGKTKGQNEYPFDIARNLRDVGWHFDACRLAAGVTVTSEPLAEMYREQGCEEVYVFPNSVVPEDYYFPNLMPHEGVRIIWEGGASHMDSWLPIKDPIIGVLMENPQAKLVVFGSGFEWMQKEIRPEQIEMHPWIGYDGYKLKRVLLDADINLCPLQDQPFTRAKSAIRWYEGALGPRPEAALAADVGPYKEIEDGKTGLLYSGQIDFVEKLTALIRNADLRKNLAWVGQKWVLDNRTPEKTVPGLVQFYEHLLAKKRQEALKP